MMHLLGRLASGARRRRFARFAIILQILLLITPQAIVGAQEAAPHIPLHSKAGIVIDAASGRVLYEYNAHQPLPPASVTKVMTLVLAIEAVMEGRAHWDDMVTASARAASMGGTQIWLETGEQMRYEDLLWAIAVGSANDAAVAIAEYLAGSEEAFAELMNKRARELGALNTHFLTASGLPPEDVGFTGEHVTTAYDLAMISRHAIQLPRFLEMVSTWGPVVMRPETTGEPVLWSLNRMLQTYPGMDGIKTGFTSEAGYSLAGTARRGGVRVIAVTLGAQTIDQRTEDMSRLLDYGFSQLRAVKLVGANEVVTQVRVRRGNPAYVGVTVEQDVYATMLRTEEADVQLKVEWAPEGVRAPLAAGETVGTLIVMVAGNEVGRYPLVTTEAVEEAAFLETVLRNARRLLGSAD